MTNTHCKYIKNEVLIFNFMSLYLNSRTISNKCVLKAKYNKMCTMFERRLEAVAKYVSYLLFVCNSNKFWKLSSIIDLVSLELVKIILFNIDIQSTTIMTKGLLWGAKLSWVCFYDFTKFHIVYWLQFFSVKDHNCRTFYYKQENSSNSSKALSYFSHYVDPLK